MVARNNTTCAIQWVGRGSGPGLRGRSPAPCRRSARRRTRPACRRRAPCPRAAARRPHGPTATTVFGGNGASAARATALVDRPDDGELARRRELEVERAQRPAERARRAAEHRLDEPENADTPSRSSSSSPQIRASRSSTCASIELPDGSRVVVEALRARDELLPAGRARGRSRRARRRRRARLRAARAGAPRPASAARPSRRAARSARARRSRSRRGSRRRSSCPRATSASSRPSSRRERPEQELGDTARRVEPVGALEPPRRLGERGEREAVPGGERLVVEARLRPQRALGEQPRAQLRVELAADDRAAVLERQRAARRARPPPPST